MRAEVLHTVVQTAVDVLEEVLETEVSRGKLSEHLEIQALHRVVVLTTFIGSLEGQVLFSMPLGIALSVASAISGEKLGDFNDTARTAVLGLADTVAAEMVARLRLRDILCTTGPVALLTGQGMQLSSLEIPAAALPLQMPLGNVELTIALREADRDSAD